MARPHRFGFFYYDSVGRQPPKEIREFSDKLSEEARSVFPNSKIPFRVAHNTIRKQFQDSECGIYSMFFVVAAVQTEIPFEQICKDVIKRDGTMHTLRRVFFRPPS
jgi:Ulp1 family protease